MTFKEIIKTKYSISSVVYKYTEIFNIIDIMRRITPTDHCAINEIYSDFRAERSQFSKTLTQNNQLLLLIYTLYINY